MMWRWMVLALVIANGVFGLWSHGQLRELGWGPVDVTESVRLKTQIQPEAVQVTPQEAQALSAPTAEPGTAAPAVSAANSAPTPASTAAAPAPANTALPAASSAPTQGK